MKQLLLSFIIVGCCSGYLSAQEALNSKQLVMLTGTVVDAADGQPVIAATIWHKQSNGRYSAVAATDYDGRFELSFLPEDTLMVDRIGYKTQKLLPSGDSILVRLEITDSTVFCCPNIILYPISGVVLDENGDPLIGATITIKGANRGVATDRNGKFKISAQKGDVLEVSYVGYLKQTKRVSIKKPMKIKLKPNQNVIYCQ